MLEGRLTGSSKVYRLWEVRPLVSWLITKLMRLERGRQVVTAATVRSTRHRWRSHGAHGAPALRAPAGNSAELNYAHATQFYL